MENIRKELTKRIVNECRAKETSITKDLASFLVISYNSNEIILKRKQDTSGDYSSQKFVAFSLSIKSSV